MRITKLGHCCMVIEVEGKKILTDPGSYTVEQNTLTGLDAILITHQHGDHFDIPSVKQILVNNPNIPVITNSSVGQLLSTEGIPTVTVEHEEMNDELGVAIAGFGTTHADIYDTVPTVQNTGYLIANKFYFPGDAFYNPHVPVDILALPVCGPWVLLRQAIEFAKEIKPQVAFPVHDAMLAIPTGFHVHPKNALTAVGIEMRLPEGNSQLVIEG